MSNPTKKLGKIGYYQTASKAILMDLLLTAALKRMLAARVDAEKNKKISCSQKFFPTSST